MPVDIVGRLRTPATAAGSVRSRRVTMKRPEWRRRRSRSPGKRQTGLDRGGGVLQADAINRTAATATDEPYLMGNLLG
jgi:hypothetical protein